MRGASLVLSVLLLALSSPAQQSQRGVTIPPGARTADAAGGGYYALVIGIDRYQHQTRLQTAVADARAIEAVLRTRYGFRTRMILDADATRDNIISAFAQYRRTLGDNDKLLIYYAGHGIIDGGKAYWLPVESDQDSPAHWIIADDITTSIKSIPARHVLVVSDSCYSGGLGRSAAVNVLPTDHEVAIAKMLSTRSRILISSGRDEPVADSGSGGHSVFAAAFLNGLTKTTERSFSASSLFERYVRESVIGGSDQVPLYQILQNSGHESGGDFVFLRAGVLPAGSASPSLPAAAPAEAVPEPVARPTRMTETAPLPAPPRTEPPTPMTMTQLTVTGTFQPTGHSSFPITITVTPDAGNKTYTAAMMGQLTASLSNGTSSDPSTFEFNKLKPAAGPMGAYAMLDGAMMAISAAALKVQLNPGSGQLAGHVTGNVSGSLSLAVSPLAYGRSGAGAGGGTTVSGQIIGSFMESLTPVSSVSSSPPVVATLPPPAASAPDAGHLVATDRGGGGYVWIPPGKFVMGCSPGDRECFEPERPPHEITLTKGFWLANSPTTVEAWNLQKFKLGRLPVLITRDTEGRTLNRGQNMPVVGIAFADAQTFCTQAGGRLPTEAEWEYAARAGAAAARYGELDAIAWTADNSGDQKIDSSKASDQVQITNHNSPRAVRQKAPNAWNLYDMLGGVWEWTADFYADDYYKHAPATDPKGPTTGRLRVARGGSWHDEPRAARASARRSLAPDVVTNSVGFRCAMDTLPSLLGR